MKPENNVVHRAKAQIRFRQISWWRRLLGLRPDHVEDIVIEGNLTLVWNQNIESGSLDIYQTRSDGSKETWHFPAHSLTSFSASFWSA